MSADANRRIDGEVELGGNDGWQRYVQVVLQGGVYSEY